MNSVVRALLYWLVIAPILFTVIAEVILSPTGLVARIFYEPTNQPPWLQAVLFAVGTLAYVTSGVFVWWCWRRFRIPVVTRTPSDSTSSSSTESAA